MGEEFHVRRMRKMELHKAKGGGREKGAQRGVILALQDVNIL